MKMYARVRSLLVMVLLGVAAMGLLVAGCGQSSAEGCQSDEECGGEAVCTVGGECVFVDADAGSSPDASDDEEIDSIEISPERAEVGLGLTVALEAEAFNASGEQVSAAILDWETSDEDIATIDDRGVVRAVSLGTATITARSITNPDAVAATQVEVVEGEVSTVIVEPESIELTPGETVDVVATAYNEAVEPVQASNVVWSVEDDEIAAVDAGGIVEGVTEGSTRLIANIEGVEGSATIEVSPKAVDRVEISPEEPTALVGESVQLEATGFDTEGRELSGREIAWASDAKDVATVDDSGLVEAVAAGTASISAEIGGASAQVTMTVVAPNMPPTARDHSVSMTEDGSVDLVLGADDQDDDTLTYVIETDPTSGTLSTFDASTGEVTYVPDEDYAGEDSFTFSVTDGDARSAVATVNIQIDGVNDEPVAADDAVQTEPDKPIVIPVLSNDDDVDGDSLTVSSVTTSDEGAGPTIASDGAVTYTPPSDYTGDDSFEYTVIDGKGGTDTAVVTVTVQ